MTGKTYDWVTFDDDETVVWNGQPRVISIIKLALFTVLIPIVAGVYSGMAAAAGGALLAIAVTTLGYLRLVNTDYVLTNKRLYRKTGVLSEKTESAPLNKIQNTSLSKDIIGSQRGFGTVSISTAAGAGDISIRNIDNPNELKRLLSDHAGAAATTPSVQSDGNSSTVSMGELADEVKRFRENIEDFNDQAGDR